MLPILAEDSANIVELDLDGFCVTNKEFDDAWSSKSSILPIHIAPMARKATFACEGLCDAGAIFKEIESKITSIVSVYEKLCKDAEVPE